MPRPPTLKDRVLAAASRVHARGEPLTRAAVAAEGELHAYQVDSGYYALKRAGRWDLPPLVNLARAPIPGDGFGRRGRARKPSISNASSAAALPADRVAAIAELWRRMHPEPARRGEAASLDDLRTGTAGVLIHGVGPIARKEAV